jgi:hypothetical protein
MTIKGLIYKIICNITGKVYIGSTLKTLKKRLAFHVSGYKYYIKNKSDCINKKLSYTTSFSIIENNNYKIECIEEVNNINKFELKMLEQKHILSNECVNNNVPCRTYKEWYLCNREKNLNGFKKYYLNNKANMLSKRKLYYETHKQEIRQRYLKKRLDRSNSSLISSSNM